MFSTPNLGKTIKVIFLFCAFSGSTREPKSSTAARSQPKNITIDIPSMSLDELNKLTSNFGSNALVGEGSYGRVFKATLPTGQDVAIKKLDSAQDTESDFSSQVQL